MKELQAIVRAVLAADPGTPQVLATLVTVMGSSYRRPGARLLFSTKAPRLGSISGGCLEEDVLNRANTVATTGRAELITYDTSAENDLVWGVGMGCHGIVQILLEKLSSRPTWVSTVAANLAIRRPTPLAIIWRTNDPARLGTHLANEINLDADPVLHDKGIFFDPVEPAPALIVFGAGDDAQPLVRFVKELGWHVTVADPRSAFANPVRFPEADRIVVASADELVDRIAPASDALAVVMTHHYVHDRPILERLVRRPMTYLGLLGPRKRAAQILADVGAAPDVISEASVHAPVGLDLGAETPDEVALSIVAEMCAVVRKRDARPLRERTRPIHA